MTCPRPCRLLPALAIALAALGWPVPDLAAQETPSPDGNEAAVRAALEHYLQGHATGDPAHFRAAFHEVADLYWVADGALQTLTGNAYVARAPGTPAANEAERSRRIAWIEVAGDAAVARVELDYPGVFFVDYMSLLRIDGEWRIVNKTFHADRTGALVPTSGPPRAGGPTGGR